MEITVFHLSDNLALNFALKYWFLQIGHIEIEQKSHSRFQTDCCKQNINSKQISSDMVL